MDHKMEPKWDQMEQIMGQKWGIKWRNKKIKRGIKCGKNGTLNWH